MTLLRLKPVGDSVPHSLEYWIARSTPEEIYNAILATKDETKINEVLAFFGRSRIIVGDINTPGEQVGDILIQS